MDDASIVLTRRKLDADDFYCMVDVGILGKADRVELIDGEIIEMASIGRDHGSVVGRLNEALVMACAGRAVIFPQTSIRLDSLNVPEPDFAVLRRRADFYATGEAAGPADALLFIEVSDSSLRYDRTVKLPLYARAGVPEYWIVDLKRRAVETFRLPEGNRYSQFSSHRSGDTLTLSAAPEITMQVDQVFG